MSWALWLAIPVALTLVAALITWLRSRPARIPDTAEAMQAHSEYLDALAQTGRVHDGGSQPPPD
jgi:cytochrome c-type biogenesis protein CcmH/NrfF